MSPPRYQMIAYAGVFLFVLGILLQFVIMPPILNFELKKKLALKKGWPMRETWSKLPFVVETHMYVFNVTNHREIGMGATPIVREIGPFVYDTYIEKIRQTDHEEDDSVSYVMNKLYHFNPQKSNGLSDELEVYFPHTYIMTASTGIPKDKPVLASFMSRSVDSVLHNPESLFYKVNIRTLLFDGFDMHCGGVDDFFGKLTCNRLKEEYFEFTVRQKDADTYYTSMFGFMNGTYDKQSRVRVNRGIKSLQDVGRVVEMDGRRNLSIWKNDKCNAFAGTDGTIFPPRMNPNKANKHMSMVSSFLCRTVKLTYEAEVKFSGLKLLRYTVDLGTDGDHVPEDKCYCFTPETCLRKGMMDLYRCLNVPVIISNAHFYGADPYYLSRVDTLRPDKEKHLTYVDFDALTGSPVRAHTRAQINMELKRIEAFRIMSNYTYAMLPMVWTDEIVLLPDFLLDQIKDAHVNIHRVQVLEFALMIGGLLMCALSGYMRYKSDKVTELDSNGSRAMINGDARSAAVLPSVD